MADSKKKRTRRSFSDELKREAVVLFHDSGVSAEQVSAELGISTSLLYRWVRDSRDDPPEADRPRYKELEKEFQCTRRECDTHLITFPNLSIVESVDNPTHLTCDHQRASLPVDPPITPQNPSVLRLHRLGSKRLPWLPLLLVAHHSRTTCVPAYLTLQNKCQEYALSSRPPLLRPLHIVLSC